MKKFAYRPPEHDFKINILDGSVRSGKTWGLHPKILYCASNTPGKGYHVGGRKILTGVSKQTVYNNVLLDLFNIIGPRNYSYNAQSGRLRLFDTEWIVMGSKDAGSEKYVRGMTVGIAICDELTKMPQDFYRMLYSRMSPAGARLYATTNPDSPYHWVRTEILDNREMRAAQDLWYGHFTMEDNPNLTRDYVESQKRAHKGLFYKRFIEGLWVMAEGAVYGSAWSDDLVYDDHSAPFGLRVRGGHVERFIPLDYGTANATCFYDVFDDGKTYWIDDEYYWDSRTELAQKTDSQYADDLEGFIASRDARNAQVVCDPSAASLKAEMSNRGIWYCDGDNDVLPGIAKVSSLLSQKKLRIHKRCEHLIKQLQAYSWDNKACLRGEEKPIKHEDHGPDAIRVWAYEKVPQWRLSA